jgi:hypothetical protein
MYTANGLELDFYSLIKFFYEIQPRQGLNVKHSKCLREIIALDKRYRKKCHIQQILG